MVRPVTPYTIAESPPRDLWEAFVAGHPKGSVFHTPDMHEVHARTRRLDPLSLAALDDQGQIAALLCAVRIDTLHRAIGAIASRSVLFAEPIHRPDAAAALGPLIRAHDTRIGRHVLFTEVRPLCPPGEERAALEAEGYDHQPYLNFLIDLRRSPEELRASFSAGARKNISRAGRAGFTVEEQTGLTGVRLMYPFLEESYRRSRVPLAHLSMFEAAAEVLAPTGALKVFIGYLDGEPVGAESILLNGTTAFWWYGATSRLARVAVRESLFFECARWAAEHGFELLDLGGAGWPDKPYGVREFKRRLGGELVCFGRYRRVYSPRRLALAEGAYDLVRTRAAPVARLVFGAGRGSRDAAEDQGPDRARA